MLFADQVDKKALLAFVDERIQTIKLQLERAEQRQEQERVLELSSKKFIYEDLQVRVSRGDFDHHPES